MENYRFNSEMLNSVATDYWIYVEYDDGFGKPQNAFFKPKKGDDLRSLQKVGKPEVLIWEKSDLKLHLRFPEFLDCKYFHRDTNLQARLAEQVFVQNNTLWKGLGFTPHQMVLSLSLGVTGIYDVPENTNFSWSLNRIKADINKNQVATHTAPPNPRGQFPMLLLAMDMDDKKFPKN